jgi:uncharacterized membrane protein YheB (UPF0754 family)
MVTSQQITKLIEEHLVKERKIQKELDLKTAEGRISRILSEERERALTFLWDDIEDL